MARRHIDGPIYHDQLARQKAAFERLHQQLSALSGAGCGLASGNSPPINVLKQADMAIVTAILPGLRPGELKIDIEGNVVKLSGYSELGSNSEPGLFHLRERFAGTMERQINFPFSVDASRTHVSFACGVMILQLPRLEPRLVGRIDFDSGSDHKFVVGELGRLVDEIKLRGFDRKEARCQKERNQTGSPRSDLYETADCFRLLVDLPGVYDDIYISIEDNEMFIDARVTQSNFADCELVFSEYNLTDYKRAFKLLDTIDQSNIVASLKDGLLSVTLPKVLAKVT